MSKNENNKEIKASVQRKEDKHYEWKVHFWR